MDLSDSILFLIDKADLGAQNESDIPLAGLERADIALIEKFFFQRKNARFQFLQLFMEIFEPSRIGEVARADEIDALELGPCLQMGQIQITATRPGISAVDVEIGDEHTDMISNYSL